MKTVLRDGEVETHVTVDGDTTFIQDIQDCTNLIDRCRETKALDVLRGHRKAETFRLVAELPVVLVEALKAQGIDIMTDNDALKRVLNDPAFAAFRTTEGRV